MVIVTTRLDRTAPQAPPPPPLPARLPGASLAVLRAMTAQARAEHDALTGATPTAGHPATLEGTYGALHAVLDQIDALTLHLARDVRELAAEVGQRVSVLRQPGAGDVVRDEQTATELRAEGGAS
jgi:hypothetical protein